MVTKRIEGEGVRDGYLVSGIRLYLVCGIDSHFFGIRPPEHHSVRRLQVATTIVARLVATCVPRLCSR